MEDVSVDEILDELLPDLMDIYEHKQVRLILSLIHIYCVGEPHKDR